MGNEFVTTFPLLPRSPLVHSFASKRPASRFGKKQTRVEMPIQTEQGQPTRCSNLKHTGPRHACVPPLLNQGDPRSPRLPPALSTAPDSNPSTAATSMVRVVSVTPAIFPHSRLKIGTASPTRRAFIPTSNIQHPTSNIQHPKFQTSSPSAPFGKSPARF